MAAIRLEQIRKVFGGVVALRRIDLDVVDGEWLVVTGPAGCGKSTLLRVISGHDAPTAGRVLIDGRDVSAVEADARSIEVVRALHAVDEDRPRALSPAGLRRWLHRAPPPASPFERLRTAICATAGRPPGPAAVLADEPLAGLESGPRSAARADLQATHRRIPVTVVHATSNQGDALALGHRIAVLIDGEVAQVGPPLWIYERPATLAVASFIGDPGINLIAGTVATHQGGVAFRASGRMLVRLPPGAAALEGTPVTLGVRPADVLLSANGEGLSATVDAVEPTGPAQTVRATLDDGWPLTVVVPARPLLAPGMHARFRFAPHRLHVFGPDGRRFVAADSPVA